LKGDGAKEEPSLLRKESFLEKPRKKIRTTPRFAEKS
jgi:hypothetical protein